MMIAEVTCLPLWLVYRSALYARTTTFWKKQENEKTVRVTIPSQAFYFDSDIDSNILPFCCRNSVSGAGQRKAVIAFFRWLLIAAVFSCF